MLEIYNKEEFHKVIGEIYKITNTVNNKCYIGQTRSHRLNHDKYRPYGYLGRFNSHISEAMRSKNHSKYLDMSLRKYGTENFICEKILDCSIDELDKYETHYISEFKSKYPNGYNLTNGGQKAGHLKGPKIIFWDPNPPMPLSERKSLKLSDVTKQLISDNVKLAKSDVKHREMQMKLTQGQHNTQKFDRFKHVTVDKNNLEKYIYIRHNGPENYDYIYIKIQGKQANFIGKHETLPEIRKRALQFLNDLIEWQHNQIAGNSLETSQTTSLLETIDEGTRVMTDPNGKTGDVLDNPQPNFYVRYDKDMKEVQRLDDCGSEGINHPR